MNISDLTEDQKDKINSALNGTSQFRWSAVDEVLGVEDSEELFDCETDVMDACDLEYCERCGWIFSRNDGYGESDDDFVVCYECGDKDDD